MAVWRAYFLIYFIIQIMLYLFHLSMLILMFFQRKTTFKGPFFNILRTVLFADILCFVFVTFYRRIGLIPFVMDYLSNNTYPASGLFALVSFVTAVQFSGHVFLALNRFTIIWFPLKHNNLWRSQWYTAIILLISFLNIIWRIHEPAYFSFAADNVVNLIYVNNNVTNLLNLSLTTMYFSTTCFAAIFNFLSFVKFFIHKKNSATALLKVSERNLLFVSFVIFIAQLLRLSYNANKLLFPSNIELIQFFNSALPILSDIFAWSGSISLLLISSSTRKAYKSFYFCKNAVHINSTNPPKMFPTSTLI